MLMWGQVGIADAHTGELLQLAPLFWCAASCMWCTACARSMWCCRLQVRLCSAFDAAERMRGPCCDAEPQLLQRA